MSGAVLFLKKFPERRKNPRPLLELEPRTPIETTQNADTLRD